jgi:hypothetical protein
MRLLSFSFFLSLISLLTYANTSSHDEIVFQYAGDIGKYSIGYGQQVNSRYSFRLHYGVVPANDIQDKIETYTIKNNLTVFDYSFKKSIYKLYTGLGLYHVPGNKYKTNELAGTPDEYYRQSSIRGILYIGHEFILHKKGSIYLESGLNDVWFINSSNNDSIDYKDHVVLGVGVTYHF